MEGPTVCPEAHGSRAEEEEWTTNSAQNRRMIEGAHRVFASRGVSSRRALRITYESLAPRYVLALPWLIGSRWWLEFARQNIAEVRTVERRGDWHTTGEQRNGRMLLGSSLAVVKPAHPLSALACFIRFNCRLRLLAIIWGAEERWRIE